MGWSDEGALLSTLLGEGSFSPPAVAVFRPVEAAGGSGGGGGASKKKRKKKRPSSVGAVLSLEGVRARRLAKKLSTQHNRSSAEQERQREEAAEPLTSLPYSEVYRFVASQAIPPVSVVPRRGGGRGKKKKKAAATTAAVEPQWLRRQRALALSCALPKLLMFSEPTELVEER
eukprot:COSAG01_NODE_1118_length_11634_cov_21.281838_6_plen_173_part_00